MTVLLYHQRTAIPLAKLGGELRVKAIAAAQDKRLAAVTIDDAAVAEAKRLAKEIWGSAPSLYRCPWATATREFDDIALRGYWPSWGARRISWAAALAAWTLLAERPAEAPAPEPHWVLSRPIRTKGWPDGS